MSIDNDKFRRAQIVTSTTSKQNVNKGAQGDCLYLPVISMISNSTSYDSSDDKEYITDNCFRSNVVRNESKENQVCFSTSSATFIVSSSPPSNKTIEQDAYNIHNMIDSNTNTELLTPTRTFYNPQHRLSFRQHWISVTVITGIIVIFIIIITSTIIIH